MKNKNKSILHITSILFMIIVLLGMEFLIPHISNAETANLIITTDNTEIKTGKPIYVKIYINTKIDTTEDQAYVEDRISKLIGYFDYDTSLFNEITLSDITILDKLKKNKNGAWKVTLTKENTAEKIEFKSTIENSEHDYYYEMSTSEDGNEPELLIKLTPKKDAKYSSFGLNRIEIDGKKNYYNGQGRGFSAIGIIPKNPFDIIYNANTEENVSSMPENDKKGFDQNYIIKAGPRIEKEGYKFVSWNTKEDGTGITYLPNDIYDVNKDLTLYAQYEKIKSNLIINPNGGKYNNIAENQILNNTYGEQEIILNPQEPDGAIVKFNENGGNPLETSSLQQTVTFSEWKLSGEGVFDQGMYTYGAKDGMLTAQYEKGSITLPEASRNGTEFKGWYTTPVGGTKVGNAGEIYTPEDDITLYAQWKGFTVNFLNDDENTILYATEVQIGEDASYLGSRPVSTKEVPLGYKFEFAKWENEDELKNITKDTTVIAKYNCIPLKYKIEYCNTKNQKNDENPKEYTIEDGIIQIKDLKDIKGSSFLGWFDKEDGGNRITNIDSSNQKDITLYAQWKENEKLYLNSEKYKIGENDIDNYEVGDIYLDKIEPNTTVKEFIKNCNTNGTIKIISGNKELENDDLIGTNMEIIVTKDEEKIQLTAVVMGDLDGNGKVTATDLSTLNQVLLKMIQIKNAELKAADLDDNQKLTATDLSTINNTILKNIKLTYDKSLEKKQMNKILNF